jgi:hypothetical protein
MTVRFQNHYRCECGSEPTWSSVHDCEVDDRCPECNTAVSPHRSEEVGTLAELTMKPASPTTRHVLECDICGGENVRVEVWATMEPQTGQLVMADIQDTAWCLDCDEYIGSEFTEKVKRSDSP